MYVRLFDIVSIFSYWHFLVSVWIVIFLCIQVQWPSILESLLSAVDPIQCIFKDKLNFSSLQILLDIVLCLSFSPHMFKFSFKSVSTFVTSFYFFIHFIFLRFFFLGLIGSVWPYKDRYVSYICPNPIYNTKSEHQCKLSTWVIVIHQCRFIGCNQCMFILF